MLDDACEAAIWVAHDAAVTGRIVKICGQQSCASASFEVHIDQLLDCLHIKKRHIGAGHNNCPFEICGQLGKGTFNRTTGARQIILVSNNRIAKKSFDVFGEQITLVADHRNHVGGTKTASGGKCVMKHRQASYFVHDLRQLRTHAGAFTCSKHDHGEMLFAH